MQRPVCWVLLLVVLVAGCSEASSSDGAGAQPGASSTLPGPNPGAITPTAPAGALPAACADLYEETLLPTFDVEISEADWQGMQADCEDEVQAYRPIVFRYGAETIDAMMRLKGNWSWSCDKMQFLISFNEVNKDGRFHGLRKIVLDAPWYDPTLLHERLAFFFLKQHGVPNSCVNNARLNVNGEYYGLYANVERLDREYLERHFDDPSGNLFKEGLELTTNETTGTTATVDAFWAATNLAEVDAVVDLQHAVSVWAGLAMLPDPDSYWAGVEINFYLYEHPARGLLFLPYDTDIAFAENLWPELVEADPITYEHDEWLREEQYRIVLSDPTWCTAFQTALRSARSAYNTDLLSSKVDSWAAQIESAIAEDPHFQATEEERAQALQDLRTFPARRAQFIDAWLAAGEGCPPDWPGNPGGR